ncbi:MAG TPA: DUF4294 domain-containing protein [Bacteroidales bacterium]|nr:DUF4294 domain-containing protein [Bacteroidales bacterium]
MRKCMLFLLLSVFAFSTMHAQGIVHKDSLNNIYLGTKVIKGDTVLHIDLGEITILPPYSFKNKKEQVRYTRLMLYVKKVYPYSKLIKLKLAEIEDGLAQITNEKEKKEYIKIKEKELRNQFEDELVKLTILQGRILLKLVDRETGKSTFEQIRRLKGNFQAFFWQSIATVFGTNLKTGYDGDGDDKMIEDIIIRIENGQL